MPISKYWKTTFIIRRYFYVSVQTQRLTKTLRKRRALNELNFEVNRRTHGFLGQNVRASPRPSRVDRFALKRDGGGAQRFERCMARRGRLTKRLVYGRAMCGCAELTGEVIELRQLRSDFQPQSARNTLAFHLTHKKIGHTRRGNLQKVRWYRLASDVIYTVR
jgi:hypothetical protein